ncbi:arylsulfatase [Opitutales bacterium]|nr:arylsulfatase [Opitutales bacterium]
MIYNAKISFFLGFNFCISLLLADTKNKPNIVLFMADDMGLGDSSAYQNISLTTGSKPIHKTLKTPNLERFAEKGIIFTDAHAPASMCSSTRYSLLTGRLAHRAYLKKQGWLPHGPNRPMIQRALTTLPEMLQRNGYYTGAIGKYHVGMNFDDGHGQPADEFDYKDVDFTKQLLDGPTHHGFDEFFGVPGNTEDSLDTEPRIYIRNDKWTFTDRSKMHWMGMKHRAGQILSGPNWDLSQLGPDFLKEGLKFIELASQEQKPFFLYYVPCANHFQRNQSGDYAVPEFLDGKPVKGSSRYTDGTKGTEREDMVIENDIAFGALIAKLEKTNDPRNPGHKLMDNTLIIFTSDNGPNVGDNEGTNQESGGLRGKKAKIWEGGHRVPFIVFWGNHFEGGGINRNLFSLTDLYSTFAQILGDPLHPDEAQDSLDSLAFWKDPQKNDPRPRYFFCHLGPPYENDALTIRQFSNKVIVKGGLAQPWTPKGTRGAAQVVASYNLEKDLYEKGDFSKLHSNAESMVNRLLKIHNQGYSRELNLPPSQNLIIDDGWHNLRNDVTGEIGFKFELLTKQIVTHLGMWDDHDRELPIRLARQLPTDLNSDQPSRTGRNPRNIQNNHFIRLWEIKITGTKKIAEIQIGLKHKSILEGEFRYGLLKTPVSLKGNSQFLLTMSTTAGDGDHFHDPASFDGLSPLVNPKVKILGNFMIKNNFMEYEQEIPSFADLDPQYSNFRIPVGPTLKFK